LFNEVEERMSSMQELNCVKKIKILM
jgi:uncharacterized protein YlbG (UPF0298 family)